MAHSGDPGNPGNPTPDPHKPLRQDVRLLGALLGDTLRERGGQQLFDTVEHVRSLAKAAHAGDRPLADLAQLLGSLPVDAAIPLARAFTHFLNLANVAEQHHRIRRRRAYQRDPDSPPQRGSCEETFTRLIAGGITRDELYDAVCGLRIELVLTSQMPVAKWHSQIGDSTVAEGILDRIIHRAHRIELRGESLRMNPPKQPER